MTEAQAIKKVLDIALAEVGYSETGVNVQKYGKEIHQVQPSNMDYPAAWCDAFVDWCFYKAFGKALAKKMLCGDFDDYTVRSAQLYKDAGRWTQTPKKGYQVFFRNSGGICHTGLVYKVSTSTVYTVEGNSSDAVRKKSYSRSDAKIAGYGMPKYSLATDSAPSSDPEPAPADKPVNKDEPLSTSPKWVGKVTASSLNVRTWAGVEFPRIKTYPSLARGTTVEVCDTVYANNGAPWYYVRIAGRIYGFVSAEYIQKV